MTKEQILNLAARFRLDGRPVDADEVNTGNINTTYRVSCRTADGIKRYILQRINTYVFHDPDAVMRNISLVTDHIAAAYAKMGVASEGHVLRLIPTSEGKTYVNEPDIGCWRVYNNIENAWTVDQSQSPDQFREAGRAFGGFARLLNDFPTRELADTIPDFHNTVKRFNTFLEAVRADRAGRAASVASEIAFFMDRRQDLGAIMDALNAGKIPLRVTHNDTKINNVMLDRSTGRAVCVIDLDTVMPGSCLFDYGDAIRSGASTTAEDEPDLSRVRLDPDLFRAFTEGYLGEMKDVLTEKEKELLPMSVKVIACELAMRFLTDYLDGDLYFRIRTPDHNLIRARNQMALARDIEAKYGDMTAICRELTD